MKDVQCYELFGGIARKNHAFSFFSQLNATDAEMRFEVVSCITYFAHVDLGEPVNFTINILVMC